MKIFLIIGFLVASLVAVFAFQNPSIVSIKFFGLKLDNSLAFICLALFALGFLTGMLIMAASFFNNKWKIFTQKKQIKELEEELSNKKNHPAQIVF
jgi:uncharacterized membrane protein YciS (DUF1049 family)